MNRLEFARKYASIVKEIGSEVRTTIVSGGGALLMLGLRQSTSDMDLDVPERVFNRHKRKDNVEHFGSTVIVNYSDEVSLHVMDPSIDTMTVSGVTIYSIDELIKQKKRLMSNPERKPEKIPQDKADIEALEKLKKRQPSTLMW